MKRLLAIRHAKSDWGNMQLSDHDRPLNERGMRDAPVMAAHLKAQGIQPDVILSSTANRAVTTAKIIANHFDFPESDIITSRDLYLASAGEILRAVQSVDEVAQTVMVFGHNPGMHELSFQLVKKGSIDHFPTLAVADLEFDSEFWANIDWGEATLLGHYYPKGL